MKKHLKQIVFVVVLVVFSFSLSVIPTLAASCTSVEGGVGSDGSWVFNAGYSSSTCTPSGGSGWVTNSYGLPGGTLYGIITGILNWLLAILAIMGIIGFVISGIFYLLAGADEDNVKKGKTGMTYSILGIIVGLSGYIIMKAVETMLSGGTAGGGLF